MKKAFIVKCIIAIALLLIVLILTFFLTAKPEFKTALFKKIGIIKEKVSVANIVRYFPFSMENSLKEWEEKVLKGKVVYRIEKAEDLSYVRAQSKSTASALYYKIKLDINKNPVLSWKWQVDEFPKRTLPETIEGKKEEDFAARVYVMFPAAFFTKSKVIEYIWTETLPEGTSGSSGYSTNIKVLVLETGKKEGWQHEKRNIYKDYIKLFGYKPKLDIGAVAFMTDADSTKTAACAAYDEIEIGYE